MPRLFRPTDPSQPRLFALLLALALVSAQMLGLLHRIAHADRGIASSSSSSLVPSAVAIKPAPRTPAGGLLAVFAGHDQPHDCDAFDQMSHADLAVGHAFDLATACAPVESPAVHSAWHVAAQAQGFLARGPPLRS